jgi:hypothetical protein
MVTRERDGREVDESDVHIGRLAIAKGLVAPGDVLEAIEEQAREADRGRSVKLAEVLVRLGKLRKEEASDLVREPRALALGQDTETRHLPTLQLDGGSWRVLGDAPARVDESSEVPPLAPTEHRVTQEGAAPGADVTHLSSAEPESEPQIVIPDTPPATKRPSGVPKTGARMGAWLLEEELGRGGMGIIFKARHEWRGETAAVKVLRDPTRTSLVERFTRETEVIRRLEHPNIVRILDAGLEGYYPWFAMELVVGEPLSRVIRSGAVVRRTAVEILRDVARAVHHAHEQCVLHRDLKPANVLVATDGTVKVSDFGLAKLEDDERALTRPGAPLGTPAYMSPEQAMGTMVDRRTDVFALGVMLFEAVSGRLPWSPERLAAVYGGGRVTMPRMRHGDSALEAIVGRATDARPEGRFESAEAFARELDAWLEGHTPPSSRMWEQLKRARNLPRSVELGAAALAGALVVLTVFEGVLRYRERGVPAPAAAPLPAPAPVAPVVAAPAPARVPVTAPVTAPAPVPVTVTARVPAPVPATGPARVPIPVPCAAPAAPPPPETEPRQDPAPVREVARRLSASLAVVSVGPETVSADAVALVASAEPAAEAQLTRVKAGRLRLVEAVASLRAYDGFDEGGLVLRARATGKKVSLASLDPSLLLAAIPRKEERSCVACYLRARGLPTLASALDGGGGEAPR